MKTWYAAWKAPKGSCGPPIAGPHPSPRRGPRGRGGCGGWGGAGGACERAGAALPQWGGGHTCLGRPPASGPPAARLPPSKPELEPGAGGRSGRLGKAGSVCRPRIRIEPSRPFPRTSRIREQEPGSGRHKPGREGSQKPGKPGTLASGAWVRDRNADRAPGTGARTQRRRDQQETRGTGRWAQKGKIRNGTRGASGRGQSASWLGPKGRSEARWGGPRAPEQGTPEGPPSHTSRLQKESTPQGGRRRTPVRSPARPPA